MAATGPANGISVPVATDWDHDHDTVKPYYGSYRLESYGIKAEYTVAPHAAMFRFTFPPGVPGDF